MIKAIIKILKVINANTKPAHVAGGIAFAMLLALVPANNLLWIALFALTFFLKINTTMQLVFLGLFKLAAPLAAGISNNIGYSLLTNPAFKKFFTDLADIIIIPFTDFNYTLVTGGFVLGVIVWLPLFFLTILILKLYRQTLQEKIANSRLIKGIKNLPLISKLVEAYSKTDAGFSELG